MAQSKEKSQSCLNVILLGEKGAGKSASGNTILNRSAFSIGRSTKTASFQKESEIIDGIRLDVYDTPALFDTEMKRDIFKTLLDVFIHVDQSGPFIFLLVIKIDTFTEKQKKYVEEIEKHLGDWRLNTWILFTGGDELKLRGTTAEKWIAEKEELNGVIKRFQNRYHVFNNKQQNQDQVKKLIEALKNAPLSMIPEMKNIPRKTCKVADNPNERRIVLLGKTGVGKSATGNTILGENRFRSEFSFSSVTARSEMQQAVVDGRNVSVVDTPGLFDTSYPFDALGKEIGNSIFLSKPGPHAFLYVLPLNRFTEQEEDVVHISEMIFGEEMRKYTIVLFTHGEVLQGRSLEMEIQKNRTLRRFLEQCGDYHVFNNNDQRNREQVTELLKKIDKVVEKNGGSFYSNQMFEDAENLGREGFFHKYWKHFLIGGAILLLTFFIPPCVRALVQILITIFVIAYYVFKE